MKKHDFFFTRRNRKVLSAPVVTHSHVTKPCLYFAWHFYTFAKPCQQNHSVYERFVYTFAFESSFIFFPFWSGANKKKITRKWPKGHCPETGEVPAVIRGRPWRSGSPPPGSQTHRSALQRCLRLDQWRCIILGPDTKLISQGTSEQSLWKQNGEVVLIGSFRFSHCRKCHLTFLSCFTCKKMWKGSCVVNVSFVFGNMNKVTFPL